jgi:spermidine/putrescine ABC transporter ATP-binding subunit
LGINTTNILKGRRIMEEKVLIKFRNIVKEFDGTIVLKGINLDIYENEFVTLLGPSGCGKTTLLRILGGFLEADEGAVIFDNEDIKELPPYKRELNTVFQKYALFPHMNVYDNIAFGLKIKKMSKDVIDQKVLRMLKLIGLEGFENKNVTTLSGGQQQRIAIARALVNEPKVLLLDEPLGALDLKLRKEMQYELKRIQQEVGITFIYVTHDQEEALTMSDKIVIMKSGEIQQVGTPQEIYNEPVNKYVANFIGESNVISGTMIEDYKVKFDDQIFDCVDFGFKPNEKVDIVIRPEDIDIVPLEQGKITGEVLSVLFKGVWNEAMVETVPGTTVKVNMNVIKNHDVESEYSDERISANDFYVDIEEVASLDDNDIIARADAQAWKESDDSYTSISKIEHNLEEKLGEYTVTFQTASGLTVSRKIIVVDQKFVKNEKANEAVSAFNFFKTVDEIKESVALDTDLKTWANAIGWKLSNEDEAVDIYVDYDFDPENIQEGIYQVTFSTEGRELKVHTTDYVEEGQEVGLTFEVEDIHVMEKMGF